MVNVFDRLGQFSDRLSHAWNTFQTNGRNVGQSYGGGDSRRPDRARLNTSNERSIINAIYTRLGIDFSSVDMYHVLTDEEGRYLKQMDSGLNNCLTLEANIDQGSRAFKQDLAMQLFENGAIAVVAVDAEVNPKLGSMVGVRTLRVGRIVTWWPRHVRVSLYNDLTGEKEEVDLPKDTVAIVENPLYSVMNEPNSILQRLIRKLNLLDVIDEQSGSGKIDIILQLPYTIKTEARRAEAEKRRKDIEVQMTNSKYGVAYVDGTEKITQLNRPVENNLLKQVEYLTNMVFAQLGLTEGVFDGTADEATMLNYYNRTTEPLLAALQQELKRKFLTKTARTQRQSVEFFRDPFKLVTVSSMAEIGDKFTRNEILTSNEVRSKLGFKPSSNPRADELINKNMPEPVEPETAPPTSTGKESSSNEV